MNHYDELRTQILAHTNFTIRELLERKSVRAFEDRTISEEDKLQILLAASEAPSAGCQQLYTILDITDQKLKEQLSETCDHQPFIAKAPMVLVFCTDCSKWYEAFASAGSEPRLPGVGDLLLAITDTAIAAQNAVTAAWSLGIGSCYIGDILENCEIQRELLGLPEYVVPSVMIVFGYPTDQQKNRTKPARFDLKHIVFENKYPEWDASTFQDMFEQRRGTQTHEDWMDKFCKRKYNSDFSVEMTRSAAKYLDQFKTLP